MIPLPRIHRRHLATKRDFPDLSSRSFKHSGSDSRARLRTSILEQLLRNIGCYMYLCLTLSGAIKGNERRAFLFVEVYDPMHPFDLLKSFALRTIPESSTRNVVKDTAWQGTRQEHSVRQE